MIPAVGTVGAVSAVMLLAVAMSRHVRPVRALTTPPRTTRHTSPGVADWAALLDVVGAEVRAGSSLDCAWEVAWQRHRLEGRALRSGMSVRDLSPYGCTPDEAIVVHVITAAASLGGSIAPTIDAAAALLREREAARADARAHSAQARLSAQVLTAVPVVFAGWNFASSASVRAAGTGRGGLTALTAGVVCNLVGWRWMRRIVDRATR